MRLSGYQPQYFPRLHYFARILDSDIFEISDYVQFVKKHAYPGKDGVMKRGKSYQADTPIKLQGGIHFLTVPVKDGGLLPINNTPIDYSHGWQEKHLKIIESAYKKTPQFQMLFPSITNLIVKRYESIGHLNIASILFALYVIVNGVPPKKEITVMEINNVLSGNMHPFRLKKVVFISETPVKQTFGARDANDWIIDMCKYFRADEYYFGGTSASAYMNFDKLKSAGIKLAEQNWICKEYFQKSGGDGFITNLSILDLLMNADGNKTREVLLG